MSICTRCQTEFTCGMADPQQADDAPCWCTALPPLPPSTYVGKEGTASCYCPACLRELVTLRTCGPA